VSITKATETAGPALDIPESGIKDILKLFFFLLSMDFEFANFFSGDVHYILTKSTTPN
jgi:hypothetical protein